MPLVLKDLFYHVAYGRGVVDNQDMLHVVGQAVEHVVDLGTIEAQVVAYFCGRKRALFYQLIYGFLANVKIFADFSAVITSSILTPLQVCFLMFFNN
jgi:hypothetical protein